MKKFFRGQFDQEARNKILNIVLFQIAWFSCLLLDDKWYLAITAVILVLHQLFVLRSAKEWLFILSIASLGATVDVFFGFTGVLNFGEYYFLIPPWLVCIWLVFATTLNHSFVWLKDHVYLAAALGAVGGPASYFAGTKLSDVSFSSSLCYSLLCLAIFWAAFLPLSMLAVKKMLPILSEDEVSL